MVVRTIGEITTPSSLTYPRLVTATGLCVAVGSFALGWWAKPTPHPIAPESRTTASASARASTGRTGSPRDGTALTADQTATAAAGARPTHLTPADISSLGKIFREATDPLLRREAFGKLLAGLTPENALTMREQIAHLEANHPEFRDFHFAWGKIDGPAAIANGAITTDTMDMAPTLAGWASMDPAAAKTWYESLQEKGKGPSRDQFKEAFVHGLAIADPALAVDFISGLRDHAFYEVARAQMKQNPTAAAEWAASLAGEKSGRAIVYGITTEWASRDGAAAVKWLDTLRGDQSASYGPALASWAKADPRAASQHIAAMPPSESRNTAIGGLVYSHRWEDPVAAIAWAHQITNDTSRQASLAKAAEAYLHKDPASAATWLPTSGLSTETQQRLLAAKK
jgi:hypothetical protein